VPTKSKKKLDLLDYQSNVAWKSDGMETFNMPLML